MIFTLGLTISPLCWFLLFCPCIIKALMNTMIECMRHQREYADRVRGGADGARAANDRDAVLSLQHLRQLQQEHLSRILAGNVGTRPAAGAATYAGSALVYGVPSYPAEGRVIGFYNETTMAFELDDTFTSASPSDIHQLIVSGGAADAEAADYVAVGVPITFSADAPPAPGAEGAGGSAAGPGGDRPLVSAAPADEGAGDERESRAAGGGDAPESV